MSQQSNYKLKYQRFIDKRRQRPLTKEKGYEIHHILPTSLGGNNDKENLVKLTLKEHHTAHKYLAKMYEGKARLKMEIALGVMKHDRNITRKTSLELWQDPEYRKKQSESHIAYHQKNKEYNSNRMKERWKNPEFRKKVMDARKKLYATDEWKAKRTKVVKKMWADPETRKKIVKGRWGTKAPS